MFKKGGGWVVVLTKVFEKGKFKIEETNICQVVKIRPLPGSDIIFCEAKY